MKVPSDFDSPMALINKFKLASEAALMSNDLNDVTSLNSESGAGVIYMNTTDSKTKEQK